MFPLIGIVKTCEVHQVVGVRLVNSSTSAGFVKSIAGANVHVLHDVWRLGLRAVLSSPGLLASRQPASLAPTFHASDVLSRHRVCPSRRLAGLAATILGRLCKQLSEFLHRAGEFLCHAGGLPGHLLLQQPAQLPDALMVTFAGLPIAAGEQIMAPIPVRHGRRHLSAGSVPGHPLCQKVNHVFLSLITHLVTLFFLWKTRGKLLNHAFWVPLNHALSHAFFSWTPCALDPGRDTDHATWTQQETLNKPLGPRKMPGSGHLGKQETPMMPLGPSQRPQSCHLAAARELDRMSSSRMSHKEAA